MKYTWDDMLYKRIEEYETMKEFCDEQIKQLRLELDVRARELRKFEMEHKR
jgi:hypothetical protein